MVVVGVGGGDAEEALSVLVDVVAGRSTMAGAGGGSDVAAAAADGRDGGAASKISRYRTFTGGGIPLRALRSFCDTWNEDVLPQDSKRPISSPVNPKCLLITVPNVEAGTRPVPNGSWLS